MRAPNPAWLLLLAAALPAPLAACGARESQSSSPPPPAPVTASVGASGATVTSSDGHLVLHVPPGAIASDVKLTITPSSAPGVIGVAYDVTPSDVQLAAPIELTYDYAGVDLAGGALTALRIGAFDGTKWKALSGYALDTKGHTLTATATHLASFAASEHAEVCVARSGGACALSDPSCNVTCAQLDPCGDIPSANKTECQIFPDHSYTATCCYDPSVPYCVTSGGGGSSCGGSGGSGAPVTCPPPPSCNDATCPDGASMKSCTDGNGSYEATCCYPPGVLPDPGPSSSSSSSGGDAGAIGSSTSGGSGGSGSTSGSSGGSTSGSSSSSGGSTSGSSSGSSSGG